MSKGCPKITEPSVKAMLAQYGIVVFPEKFVVAEVQAIPPRR